MILPSHIVAVGGVVINDKDEILLVRHTKDGAWGCPGGQVENGENLIDALMREIFEESGASVTVDKLFWVGSNTASHEGYNGVKTVPTKVIFNFTCTYTGGTLRGSGETSEARFFPKDAVYGLLPPATRDRFKAFLEFTGGVRYMAYTSRPYMLDLNRDI